MGLVAGKMHGKAGDKFIWEVKNTYRCKTLRGWAYK